MQDLVISGLRDTNRALDGDVVFVELLDLTTTEGEGGDGGGEAVAYDVDVDDNNNIDCDDHTDEDDDEDEDDVREELGDAIGGLNLDDGTEFNGTTRRVNNDAEGNGGKGKEDEAEMGGETPTTTTTWRRDAAQRALWNPAVDLPRHSSIRSEQESARAHLLRDDGNGEGQMRGRLVHVCALWGSGLRIVLVTLRKQIQGENGRVMLIPSNRALPYSVVPRAAER